MELSRTRIQRLGSVSQAWGGGRVVGTNWGKHSVRISHHTT